MSKTEPDCMPLTNLEMDPYCWEEVPGKERGIRLFFVLASYRGTPSIIVHNHREKRKICFEKSVTLRVSKTEVCFDKKKIVPCP